MKTIFGDWLLSVYNIRRTNRKDMLVQLNPFSYLVMTSDRKGR